MTRRVQPTDTVHAESSDHAMVAARSTSEAKASQKTAGSAGVAQPSAPQPTAVPASEISTPALDVFELLQSAVADIEAKNSTAAAAGVSARMRQIEPSFSLGQYGFRTFRGLLAAAEAKGLVRVVEPEGASDQMVLSASASDVPKPSPHAGRTFWLPRDLWQAVLDHRAGGTYAYSRRTRTTTRIGANVAGLGAEDVIAPMVAVQDVSQWMRDFAEAQPDDARATLLTALDGTNPVGDFEALVRRTPTLERHWKRALHANVLDRVSTWAVQNGIPLSELEVVPEVRTPPQPRLLPAPPKTSPEDDDLRQRILSAVAAMPLSELLKLPIPVEYVLRR